MKQLTRRPGFITFGVLALVTILAFSPVRLSAATDTGRLVVVVKVSDNVLADRPARASVVTAEGVLAEYAEQLLVRAPNTQSFMLDRLPAGVYDVRVEAEGTVTEVKRGVPVFAGRDETVVIVSKPGEGLHIVEYAVGCITREEVAARLAKLEADVSRLRAELETLRSQ